MYLPSVCGLRSQGRISGGLPEKSMHACRSPCGGSSGVKSRRPWRRRCTLLTCPHLID
jgi:hypothetical protein